MKLRELEKDLQQDLCVSRFTVAPLISVTSILFHPESWLYQEQEIVYIYLMPPRTSKLVNELVAQGYPMQITCITQYKIAGMVQ